MSDRRGISVLEVAFVVFMVLLLLGVLVIFIVQSRGQSRRDFCAKRQTDIAEALFHIEGLGSGFPGYVNRIEGRDGESIEASWAWLVIGARDERTILESETDSEQPRYFPWLVCPADPPAPDVLDKGPLSYVVNCGIVDEQGDICDGVFRKNEGASREYLEKHNGAANVFLLSENIQAGRWTDLTIPDVGMVAFESPGPCSAINQCRDVGDRPQELQYARPSRFHKEGVNAIMCGGASRFIHESIDPKVFRSLMAPSDIVATPNIVVPEPEQ